MAAGGVVLRRVATGCPYVSPAPSFVHQLPQTSDRHRTVGRLIAGTGAASALALLNQRHFSADTQCRAVSCQSGRHIEKGGSHSTLASLSRFRCDELMQCRSRPALFVQSAGDAGEQMGNSLNCSPYPSASVIACWALTIFGSILNLPLARLRARARKKISAARE